MEITPDILIAIGLNIGRIEEHQSNVAYWNLVMGALDEEKSDMTQKEYSRHLRLVQHRIRRNEKKIKELQKRVNYLQRKYTRATGEEPWLTQSTETYSTIRSTNVSPSKSSSTEKNSPSEKLM